jgi:hypothetical protein
MAIDVDAPITLEHKSFVDYAFNHWLDSLKLGVKPKTLCLLGPPGIGKSAAAFDLQKRMTDYVRQNPMVIFGPAIDPKTGKAVINKQTGAPVPPTEDEVLSRLAKSLGKDPTDHGLTMDDVQAVAELLDFTSKLPEDLGGLPFRSEDGYTDYCPQRWVAKLCRKFAFGVYVQDDLPAAPQAMQVAGRQAALERRIHEHRFSDGVLVMVTGNRREDKASASTLPSHFRNSITLLAIEPSLDEWKKWYAKQEGVASIVAAFLTWKPEHLSRTPAESKDRLGAFPTPRQWFSLGRQFRTSQACGDAVMLAVASGLVGKGVALEFQGFVEIHSQLVPPPKVYADPEGALPNPRKDLDEPSKIIAMVMALGEIAAHNWKRGKGKVKDEAPKKLLKSLAWVAQAGDEYSAVGVQTFLDNGGNLTAIARVARDERGDPVIGRLLDHVKSALLGS